VKYLLDTNAVIAVVGGRPSTVRDRFERELISGLEVAMPMAVSFELWYGTLRSRYREASTRRLREFLSKVGRVVPFDAEDAVSAAEIRAYLEKQGTPIGPYDVLIAAQALRRDATLVTANLSEFHRVPGLRCENWAEA
jgi:tRNA(fMet)-specific endonuclease VapC